MKTLLLALITLSSLSTFAQSGATKFKFTFEGPLEESKADACLKHNIDELVRKKAIEECAERAIPESQCLIVSESKAKVKKKTWTKAFRKMPIDGFGTYIYVPIPKTYTLGYYCTKTVKVVEDI